MTVVYAARDLGSQGRLTRRPVAEVMTMPAPILSAHTPIADAVADMACNNIAHAAVVDRHGRCLGLVSHASLMARWAAERRPATVAVALPATPAVVASNAVVQQAARAMRGFASEAVAVTDQLGRPVGLLTEADLIGLLAQDR